MPRIEFMSFITLLNHDAKFQNWNYIFKFDVWSLFPFIIQCFTHFLRCWIEETVELVMQSKLLYGYDVVHNFFWFDMVICIAHPYSFFFSQLKIVLNFFQCLCFLIQFSSITFLLEIYMHAIYKFEHLQKICWLDFQIFSCTNNWKRTCFQVLKLIIELGS